MCQKSKTQSNAVGKSLRYYLFVFIFCVFGVAQVNAQLRLRIDGIDRVGKLKFDSCTDFEENKDPYGIPYTKDNGEKIYLLPKPGTIATVTYASEEKDKIIIKDVDKNGVLIASSITIKSSSEGELDTSLFPNIENIEIQIIQEYGSTIPDTYFVAIGKISGTINEIQLDGLLTSGKLVFDKKCARFKKSNKSGVIVQGMDGKEYTLLPCERSIAKFTDKDGIVKEIMFSGIGEKNLLEASLVTHGEIKATVSRKETEKVFPKIPNTV
ncbi:MAG: hypothetical protein ACE5HI_07355, partial [bacterium]